MHSIIKSSFYIIFILISFSAGISMIIKSQGDKKIRIFGFMVLLLGIGESFHLVPRILEIFSDNSENFESFIDTGRFIASMTIVFVYIVLFWFWKTYFKVNTSKNVDIVLYVLAIVGVILSVVFRDAENTLLIVLRNLPILMIGTILIVHFKKHVLQSDNKSFKYLWLVILLALVFTVGFELLSASYPLFIILMMPKTLMYIWLVVMGYLTLIKKH